MLADFTVETTPFLPFFVVIELLDYKPDYPDVRLRVVVYEQVWQFDGSVARSVRDIVEYGSYDNSLITVANRRNLKKNLTAFLAESPLELFEFVTIKRGDEEGGRVSFTRVNQKDSSFKRMIETAWSFAVDLFWEVEEKHNAKQPKS